MEAFFYEGNINGIKAISKAITAVKQKKFNFRSKF